MMSSTENTYEETVLRFRVLRHEELPESHKAEYRLRGIDPDDTWSLIWSFETLEAAERCLEKCNDMGYKTWTHKLVDNGQASTITRFMF